MSDLNEQGTEAWIAERLGRVTASRISDMLARTKSGWGAGRMNYAAQLVAERLTGVPGDSYRSPEMQRGSDTEGDAKRAYVFRHDVDIDPVGFVPHPVIPMSGASPDGLVGSDGLVEVKCPNTATHIDTLLEGAVPGKYVLQMQWQMSCTGRQWCDYVSFDPRLPETMSLFVHRIHRDPKKIDEIETEVVLFLNEVDATVRALRKRYGDLRQAA